MKRHVIDCSRRRVSFEERDRDIVIPNRNSFVEIELLLQTERALKPASAFLRIAHRESKMTDNSKLKWHLNFHIPNQRQACQKRTHPGMVALALILCAAMAA